MSWMKYKWIYFTISGFMIALSLYAIFSWHFKLAIDFTGGSVAEYKFEKPHSKEEVVHLIEQNGKYHVESANPTQDNSIQLRFGPEFNQEGANNLTKLFAEKTNEKVELSRLENVGPVLSQEILRKTYFAVALSAVSILLLIAWQFKDIRLGVMAVIAVIHDLIILFGTFAYLGRYQNVELDILFVTAVLTIFSLSLYDTIVVYDRIRESSRKLGSVPMSYRADRAVSETIVRSLNTSLTTSFVLFALFLMGGVTIKWFAFALLVGTITGTYSSAFVAVPLLVVWDEFKKRLKE